MSVTLRPDNAVSDLRIVSTDYTAGLPLVHDGPYSYVCRMLAAPTAEFSVPLRLFSHDAAVKVFRTGDGWEELLLSLLNFHASRPAAFTHRYITSSLFVNVHEISTRGIRSTKAMVTRWYGQGDVLTYLKRHPGASKFALAVQASKALQHLHSFHVIHGNIHPGNIFVTDDGHATITDVSVYTFARQVSFRLQADAPFPPQDFSVYHSPELLSSAFVERTKAMDVYSFALTIFAMFTGRAPSRGLSLEGRDAEDLQSRHIEIDWVTNEIIPDELLQLLQSCCVVNPAARPSMSEVVERLDYIELYH